MKAVRLNEFGGPEVLKIEDVPEPTPRSHHVLIKVDSAGVNFADVLRRGGGPEGRPEEGAGGRFALETARAQQQAYWGL